MWGGDFSIRLPKSERPLKPSGIAISAIFLNEGRYLDEWIAFHRVVGVDHFFLYDNGSSDRGCEVLSGYIRRGFVTIIPWRTFAARLDIQKAAYAHCVVNFGSAFEWLAFVDIDEFVVPTAGNSLKEVLASFPKMAALYAPRVEFGHSDQSVSPDGLLMEIYTSRYAGDRLATQRKTIARPSMIRIPEIHKSVVDGDTIAPPETGPLRINHYFSKSSADFAAKLERGWRNGKPSKKIRLKHSRYTEINRQTCRDGLIGRFIPAVRSFLAEQTEPSKG